MTNTLARVFKLLSTNRGLNETKYDREQSNQRVDLAQAVIFDDQEPSLYFSKLQRIDKQGASDYYLRNWEYVPRGVLEALLTYWVAKKPLLHQASTLWLIVNAEKKDSSWIACQAALCIDAILSTANIAGNSLVDKQIRGYVDSIVSLLRLCSVTKTDFDNHEKLKNEFEKFLGLPEQKNTTSQEISYPKKERLQRCRLLFAKLSEVDFVEKSLGEEILNDVLIEAMKIITINERVLFMAKSIPRQIQKEKRSKKQVLERTTPSEEQ